jgi:uncharacterized membrane protein
MAKKKEVKASTSKKTSKQDDSKAYAFLATFLSIIGFIIALLTKKDDKYVMHYAKQSLVLFIAAIIVGIVSGILSHLPISGIVISWVLNALITILWIISWIYALSGEIKYVPVVGHFADKIKL